MILKDWLLQEPFTLTLSSGFFSFFAHTGMVAALEEEGIKPTRLTGSSAGALVASCWAAGLDTRELKDILFKTKRQDFWDPGFGLGLLKGDRFRDILDDILPVKTFEACRAALALSAYDVKSRKTIIFDKGELIPAIYASCAIPVLFQPIKHQGYLLLDGGINDRPALAATKLGERIFYHHIASKSPWRKKDSASVQIPSRDNLTSLILYDLPRSGPTKLDVGPLAFEKAYQATKKALSREIFQGSVAIAS